MSDLFITWTLSAIAELLVIFLPRDAMHKRGLCRHAVSVRLFVRPSVTFVYAVKFFSPSCSETSPVLPYRTSWQYYYGDPLTGASNAGGVGENRDSGRIASYRSMTAAVRDQQWTVVGAMVYNGYGACLFTTKTATHQWIPWRKENRTI